MSARRSTGVILIASGSIGLFIGLVLSASLAGAICGVPMIIVCIIMMIWGYLMKAKDEELKGEMLAERLLHTQAVASGVNLCPKCKSATHASIPTCSSCGYEFVRPTAPTVSGIDPAEIAATTKVVRQAVDPAANKPLEDEHF